MTHKDLINELLDNSPRITPGGRVIFNDELNTAIPRGIYRRLCNRMRSVASAAAMGSNHMALMTGQDRVLTLSIRQHLLEYTLRRPRMEW